MERVWSFARIARSTNNEIYASLKPAPPVPRADHRHVTQQSHPQFDQPLHADRFLCLGRLFRTELRIRPFPFHLLIVIHSFLLAFDRFLHASGLANATAPALK